MHGKSSREKGKERNERKKRKKEKRNRRNEESDRNTPLNTLYKLLYLNKLLQSRYCYHIFKMERAMAPHSSTPAWKIPWTEKPGRLQPMGSLKVGHYWVTSLSLFTFMHWRRKWKPTPVFLPGESQGRGSLVGCRLWDHKQMQCEFMLLL